MTIFEAENFYKSDSMDYDVVNNKEFLKWYRTNITNGYDSYISLDGINNMINKISSWYEFKYPNREFESNDGCYDERFSNIENLSNSMDFNQLKYRLTHKELVLMNCNYRSSLGAKLPKYVDGELAGHMNVIGIRIPNGNHDDIIMVDEKTGIINNDPLNSLDLFSDTLLDDLIDNKEIDISNIKRCVNNHNTDLELRKRVCEFISLKLLYSKNTIPEYGYLRSTLFIDEVNNNIANLNLSRNGVDSLINDDYSKKVVKEKDQANNSIKKKILFNRGGK